MIDILTGDLGASVVAAASNGRLECLKYLNEVEKALKPDAQLLDRALHHVACLKYLRALGYQWSDITCYTAARQGTLEGLKYAHENGAPWTSDVTFVAAERRNFECLKYARENGAFDPSNDRFNSDIMNRLSVLLRHLRSVRRQRALHVTPAISEEGRGGQVPCLRARTRSRVDV